MNIDLNIIKGLCLSESTGQKGLKMMYKLASTVNELQDDAKIEFVALFQPVLSGNVLKFPERFAILEEIEAENGLSPILINAYQRMLKTDSFYGHIYSANDKLRHKEYSPNLDELRSCYLSAIVKLQQIALTGEDPFGEYAIEALISRLPDQFIHGEYQKMIAVVGTIIKKQGELKIKLRNKLLELKSYRYDFDVERITLIDELLKKYEPTSVEEELKTIVINPPWISAENDEHQYIDVSKNKAISLAKKYLAEEVEWTPYLIQLLRGEQRQTFAFAETIGRSFENLDALLELLFTVYQEIPLNNQNSLFLNGISVATNDDFTRGTIDKFIGNENTEVLGIRQTRFLKPIKYKDIEKIKPLIIKNPDYLRDLEYLDLSGFSDNEIIDLAHWLKKINLSFALQLIWDITRNNPDRWEKLSIRLDELLIVEGIFKERSFINNTLHIEDLLKRSIIANPNEEKIRYIIDLITKEYDGINFNNHTLLDSLTYFLLEEYWEYSWPAFGTYLIENHDKNYSLERFLERYKFNNEKLLAWASVDSKKRAHWAMKFMNIYLVNEDDSLSIEPSAKKLIDQFGDNLLLLRFLESKLSSYTINRASAEDLYKKRKQMISPFVNHNIAEVKEFAEKMIEYFDKGIEREKNFGENYELGY